MLFVPASIRSWLGVNIFAPFIYTQIEYNTTPRIWGFTAEKQGIIDRSK
jgi:hypothetical protein